jgi:hypothetical protein
MGAVNDMYMPRSFFGAKHVPKVGYIGDTAGGKGGGEAIRCTGIEGSSRAVIYSNIFSWKDAGATCRIVKTLGRRRLTHTDQKYRSPGTWG